MMKNYVFNPGPHTTGFKNGDRIDLKSNEDCFVLAPTREAAVDLLKTFVVEIVSAGHFKDPVSEYVHEINERDPKTFLFYNYAQPMLGSIVIEGIIHRPSTKDHKVGRIIIAAKEGSKRRVFADNYVPQEEGLSRLLFHDVEFRPDEIIPLIEAKF